MSELKKIDYRELGKKIPEQAPQETQQGPIPAAQEEQAQQLKGKDKASFFGSLGNRLSLMSKKERIEVLVLIIVSAAIIAVVVYYFSNTRPKFNLEASYSPLAVEIGKPSLTG